mgnify:CR=1 FL=1
MKRNAMYLLKAVLAAGIASIGLSATAQDYPNQPITFINPFNPGGSTDPVARQFISQLKKELGVDVILEHKPGGSGTIGASTVLRSKPDGYTIGMVVKSIVSYQPLVNANLPFKTPDDYQSITKLGDMPVTLLVRNDAPWKTFEEFVEAVRKNPGHIRASVSGIRTGPDLVAQEFNRIANVKLATIPFTGGGGEGLVALLGGRVEASLFPGSAGITGHIESGKLRMLAVFKKGPYEGFPDARPVVDAGYDVSLPTAFYVIAPKGLPKNVLDKLSAASMKIVNSPEYARFAKESGLVIEPKGPEEMAQEIRKDTETFRGLLEYLNKK